MYTEITLAQVREFLKPEKGWIETDPPGQEAYFDFIKNSLIIRVHSSIANQDTSRACGKDAIRVSIVAQVGDRVVGLRSFPRVTRQEHWRRNLKKRVMEAFDYIKQPKTCRTCGAWMIERKNTTKGNKFYGCIRYPKCTYTAHF